MYQRFDNLFFKHTYTIAQPLNGTFSSLTTELPKNTLESRLQPVFQFRLKAALQRTLHGRAQLRLVVYVSLVTGIGTVKALAKDSWKFPQESQL